MIRFLQAFYELFEDKKQAALFANLCCIKIQNDKFLPQGAPTSPLISNLVCVNLDEKLSNLAKNYKANYTRYADDITFSSDKNIFNTSFFETINYIINDENFYINKQKIRLQSYKIRQMVTGLVVNEKLNVRKKFIKELRVLLHLRKKYGNKEANLIYQNYNKTNKSLNNVISGKLNYLKMIKGEDDSTYLNLKRKFDLNFKTNFL